MLIPFCLLQCPFSCIAIHFAVINCFLYLWQFLFQSVEFLQIIFSFYDNSYFSVTISSLSMANHSFCHNSFHLFMAVPFIYYNSFSLYCYGKSFFLLQLLLYFYGNFLFLLQLLFCLSQFFCYFAVSLIAFSNMPHVIVS